MVEERKRKAEDGTVLRRTSRQGAASPPPPSNAPPSKKGRLITVKLHGAHSGVAERLRVLIPPLRVLIPNLKQFMSDDLGLGGKKLAKDMARTVLVNLTDSPHIQEMAIDDQLDNKEFLAAVLDYAQEALGLPTTPRASEVALVENREDNTVDILRHKLYELGMFPESWSIPLTAARMKKKNRPKSRQEDAPPVENVKKEAEEPSPIENKVDNENIKKPNTLVVPGRGRGRKKAKTEEEVKQEKTSVAVVVAPCASTGKKRGRKPIKDAVDREINIDGAAGDDGHGRRVSVRNVGKPQKQLLDISDDDDNDEEHHSSDFEGEQEEEIKNKNNKKGGARGGGPSHTAKRPKTSLPPPPTKPATVKQTAPSGYRQNGTEPTYIVTDAHRQRCYWLRRTGHQAERFNGPARHEPPHPLKADDLTSCHDCQGAHVRYTCQGGCAKSYCQSCCRHYEYLFSSQPGDVLEPLLKKFCQGVCPCCLDICGRKDCLRKHSKVYKEEVRTPKEVKFTEERKVMALHMALCLVDVQEGLRAQAEKEALRQNCTVADANELPKSAVEYYRLLCNRCATSMENVIIHCECGADICPQCCADIKGNKKGPLQCPICQKTTTSIQRVLSNPLINKLNNTQNVLDKTVAQGGAAVNAYDYKCKLWRLPTAADARVKNEKNNTNQGASGSKQQQQQQSCMVKDNVNTNSAAAAAQLIPQLYSHHPVAFPLANGNTIIAQNNGSIRAPPMMGGAPVLQPATIAPPRPNTTAALGLNPAIAARFEGIKALSLQLLGKTVETISEDQLRVLQAVFHMFVKGDFHYGTRLDGSMAQLAGITMQQVNLIRTMYGLPSGNGNTAIAPVLLPAGQHQGSDGAGPSSAPAAAAAVEQAEPRRLPTLVGPNLVQLPPRPVTTIPGCIDLINWHKDLPPEDYRIASNRPDGVQNYIWTPHVSDFSLTSPRRQETVERFVQRWAAGEPIIIRGMRGRVNWGPHIVMRSARDMKVGLKDIAVTDCSDWGSETVISADAFFKMYEKCYGRTHDPTGVELPMYKLKDFPPDETFAERCKRHNDDFLEMLSACMPEYMHPKAAGVLNLASKLPATAVPPDLGPKGYIAFGREEEHEHYEGDSVTRLHEDLSDAINILCHVQHRPGTKTPPSARCGDEPLNPPRFGDAGALWDLYRREDIPVLRQFILDVVARKVSRERCPGFFYKGKILKLEDIKDPIHDQAIILTASHRAAAALPPYNLHPWLVEQYEHEGVVIPAACAHQVRNLRSCIKIALDFVSPESVPHCLAQREERRVLAMEEVKERGGHLYANEEIEQRHFHDKLQVVNMVVHGLSEALDVLEHDNSGEGGSGGPGK